MLVDINDIKLLLGISVPDLGQDSLITLMYNKSISYIENYTGLKLDKQTIVKKYENNGSYILNLGQYPINSISELSVLIGNDFFDADYEVLTNLVDYKLKSETGEILIKYPTSGWQEYKATYEVGYDINDLPNDLNDIIIDMTVGYYKDNTKIDTQGVKSESVNGDTISYMGKVDQINNTKTALENSIIVLDQYKIFTY